MPKFKKYSLSCTCPDAVKFHDSKISNSRFIRSDWSKSGAGIQGDNEYCKHMWNALLQLGVVEKEDIPKDVPIFIPEDQKQGKDKELYWTGENESRGHRFDGGGWNSPGLSPYKGG